MLPGLTKLLGPLDLDSFLNRYWQKRHFVSRANVALVNSLARELEGLDVHKLLDRHTGVVQAWFSTLEGEFRSVPVSIAAAHAAYDSGVTLYLHRVDAPAVTRWQMRIAGDLGHSRNDITCSIFAARRGAGTRCHFDNLENITVQLAGTKSWHLSPNTHIHSPLDNWVTGTSLPAQMSLYCPPTLPARMPSPRSTVRLRTGDVLYVPRGYWHSADATADSLSLFLGFPATPCVDLVLSSIRSFLLRNAAWRENFIDAGSEHTWNSKARKQTEALLRLLESDLPGLTAEDIVSASHRSGSMLSRKRFRRNPIATLHVRPSPSRATMDIAIMVHRGRFSKEQTFPVDSALVPLCRWIGRQKTSFLMTDAPSPACALPRKAVDHLLRNLCRHGFLSCKGRAA